MAIGSTMALVWKNRRHFKMQIFGVTVLFVICVFVANLISIKISYNKQLNRYIASNTMYTSTFQLSLSGVKGTVDKIFIDSTGTQCFILASLKSTVNLATDAKNYQMYVTNVNYDGTNNGTPKENIQGEIYMFGASGIVGLYLYSDVPFENTMKQLTLRSFTKYTSNTSPYFRTTASDAQYDQCHLFFNPGGTNKKTIDFLEKHIPGTEFDLTEIYRQVNTSKEEVAIRKDILQFYDDLSAVMRKIMEYRKRLNDSYNIAVPDFPEYVQGDYFDDVIVYDAEGVEIGSYRKYVPATIVPGGTEYDWYNGSIATGYFKLVPNVKNMTIRDYIYALNRDKKSRIVPSTKIKDWYFNDGTPVNMNIDADITATSLEREIINNIDIYEDLFNQYMKLKTKYQTEYLPNLLLLESTSGAVGQVYTVRKDKAVLTY